MEINEEYRSHIVELRKLSYNFYASLARGKEPLTYTTKDEGESVEHQVEVNAELKSPGTEVDVYIGFETNFAARFDKTKGFVYHLRISRDGQWSEIEDAA